MQRPTGTWNRTQEFDVLFRRRNNNALFVAEKTSSRITRLIRSHQKDDFRVTGMYFRSLVTAGISTNAVIVSKYVESCAQHAELSRRALQKRDRPPDRH